MPARTKAPTRDSSPAIPYAAINARSWGCVLAISCTSDNCSLLAMAVTVCVVLRLRAGLLRWLGLGLFRKRAHLLDVDREVHGVMADAAILAAHDQVRARRLRLEPESRHGLWHHDRVVARASHLDREGVHDIRG